MYGVIAVGLIVILVLLVRGLTFRNVRGRRRVKTMIVLGSGGHTSEMFRFLETLDLKSSPLSPRVYVVANTDKHSKKVAESFEERIFGKDTSHYTVKFIPRSREVGQSYLSSVFTTLWSLCHCLLLMLREKPDLVLANGPGTCVPVCAIGLMMKWLGIHNTTVVLIESYACVHHLSATALILHRFVDLFCVQWPYLLEKAPKAVYTGRLANLSTPPKKLTPSHGSYALVAVGSTRFDALIQAIDCPEFVAALKKLGFEELHVQKGTGEYVPTTITKAPNFRVVVFEFTHDWKKEVENAGLVIGHAGAGTILDALELQKPLMVVPNTKLMVNHQLDIAVELAKEGYLYMSNCDSLIHDLNSIKLNEINEFPSTERSVFRDSLYKLL